MSVRDWRSMYLRHFPAMFVVVCMFVSFYVHHCTYLTRETRILRIAVVVTAMVWVAKLGARKPRAIVSSLVVKKLAPVQLEARGLSADN